MKKLILIFSLITAFSAKAEDSYQNCYGAANCMNFREYVKEYIEEHNLKSELDDYMYVTYDSDYDYNDNPDYFLSLSDDGKELTIYGPKEDGQSASVDSVAGVYWSKGYYDIEFDPDRDLFKNVESLKFEGNVSDLEEIYLPSLKNLTIPDSVSTTGRFVVPSNVVDLTIGENVPIIIKTSSSARDELGGIVLEEECSWDSEFCNALREYLKTHPEYLDEGGHLTDEIWSLEIEYDHSILENMPTTIHCLGDLEKCKDNMAQAGYEEGSYNMLLEEDPVENVEVIREPKRIYTIQEAAEIIDSSGSNTFSFKLRYK